MFAGRPGPSHNHEKCAYDKLIIVPFEAFTLTGTFDVKFYQNHTAHLLKQLTSCHRTVT
jgi:hypothetical protein